MSPKQALASNAPIARPVSYEAIRPYSQVLPESDVPARWFPPDIAHGLFATEKAFKVASSFGTNLSTGYTVRTGDLMLSPQLFVDKSFSTIPLLLLLWLPGFQPFGEAIQQAHQPQVAEVAHLGQ